MKKILPVLALMLCAIGVRAQVTGVYTTLSAFGSTWKYLDNGSNAGSTWKDSTFSDASWSSGASYLGYGDPWIVTCVNAGCGTVTCTPTCTNKYITTYFRQKVNISNPAQYDSIRIGVVRDDGAVVYVNGVEVVRSNMPTGTIIYTTGAAANVGGTAESTAYYYIIPKSYFVNGDNYIAVEVHNDVASSSDQTFNLEIAGVKYIPTPVTLVRGPYLQMGTQTGVTVRWRTNIASKSVVEIGSAPGAYGGRILDSNKVTEHIMRIEPPFLPDTKYYYRFGTDTSFLQGDSNNFFTTVPPTNTTRKMTFAMFGDCGRNDLNYQTNSIKAYYAYLATLGRKSSDVLIMNGDNAYNNGTDAEFQTNLFAAYQTNVMKNHLYYTAPGNHDYNNGALVAQQLHNVPYFSIFTTPTQGECGGVPSGTQAYYSHDYGNVHFMSLDSYGMEDYGTTRMYDTNGAQVKWIKKDLAANKLPWVICYWHHPPYTMGSHNSDNETELVLIRQNFIRILEHYGVDMVMTGHSHDYERSMLMKGYYGNEASFNKAVHVADTSSGKYDGSVNSCPYQYPMGQNNHGIVYVLSGSAGASGGIQAGYPHDALPFSQNDGGMFYFEVQGNRLDAKWVRRDSTIADQFTIIKGAKNNTTDSVTIYKGQSTTLNAGWPGTYFWTADSSTKQSLIAAPKMTTTYIVRDSAGTSCFSNTFAVKVLDTSSSNPTGIATTGTEFGASIHPVPAKDVLHLELANAKDGRYSFTIYDETGRNLRSFSKRMDGGKQRLEIDLRELPANQLLLLEVDNGSMKQSFKFTRSE